MNELAGNIVKQIKAGNRAAFDEFYKDRCLAMVGFANSYVRDKGVAENMVQDAFVKLWEKRETLKDDSNLGAFMVTIIKNDVLDYLNHLRIKHKVENTLQSNLAQSVELNYQSILACEPNTLFQKDIDKLIHQALQSMPEQTKAIFEMSRFKEMSYQEIAKHYQISVKGVGFHITKALKVMRVHLKDYLPIIFF